MSFFKRKKPFGKGANQQSSGTKTFGGRKRRGGGGGKADGGKRQRREEATKDMDEEIESESSAGEDENLHQRTTRAGAARAAVDAYEDQSGDEELFPTAVKKKPKRREEAGTVALRDIASLIRLSPAATAATQAPVSLVTAFY